jgi:DNA-binding MarR family transcriptional regulator
MTKTNNLTYLIHHLASVLTKQSDQLLKEQLGIGFSQYRILMALEWNPRIQQSVIASNLGQTEASISRQIKLLKNKGLLTSKIDHTNKRRHISVPTPMGMQVTEAANQVLKQGFTKDFEAIGESKTAKLSQSLELLHDQICAGNRAGACNHSINL